MNHIFRVGKELRQRALERDSDLSSLISSLGLSNLTSLMAELAPDCADVVVNCWWQVSARVSRTHKLHSVQGQPLDDCGEAFSLRKTDEGFCCAFNALRLSQNVDPLALAAATEENQNDLIDGLDPGIREFMEDKEEEEEEYEYYYDPEEPAEEPSRLEERLLVQNFSSDL